MNQNQGRSTILYRFGVTLLFITGVFLLPGCSSEDLNPIIGNSPPSETQVETASFDLINRDRKERGLAELVWDPQVAAVAREHSSDMRDRAFYGHQSPEGQNFADRLTRAGISFQFAGENLALTANISDPATAANQDFLNHESHRENLLNPRFTRVGVGVARSGNRYWLTQNFIGQ